MPTLNQRQLKRVQLYGSSQPARRAGLIRDELRMLCDHEADVHGTEQWEGFLHYGCCWVEKLFLMLLSGVWHCDECACEWIYSFSNFHEIGSARWTYHLKHFQQLAQWYKLFKSDCVVGVVEIKSAVTQGLSSYWSWTRPCLFTKRQFSCL